jgi:hypothetical protein
VVGAGDTSELEKSQVVRMNGSTAIDHLVGLVIVVKDVTHEVDVVCK